MSSRQSRRASLSAALHPSSEHVLPFVTVWYASALALGALWHTEGSSAGWGSPPSVRRLSGWSRPEWAPAEGVVVVTVVVASVFAYVAASALIATRSDPLPAASRPRSISMLAFAIVTVGAFGAWLGRGRSAFDGETLIVGVACCWPAEVGFRIGFGLLWYGLIPTAAFLLLVGIAGAVTALWQYWLAGWLALGWRAVTAENA